jgi:hypothetical protein
MVPSWAYNAGVAMSKTIEVLWAWNTSMTTSKLVLKIRGNGGQIWLDALGLHAEGVSESQVKELGDSHGLVVALLREEIAATRWERSGKDLRWWLRPEQAWNQPDQTPTPILELVRTWISEECFASTRCCTKMSALHRKFAAWSGFERRAETELEFIQRLAALGYPDSDGWVDEICLVEDSFAARLSVNDRPARLHQDDSEKCMPNVV